MWDLYDRLIAAIPEDARAEEVIIGRHWVMLQATCGAGLAMAVEESSQGFGLAGTLRGRPLVELAALVKSWNFLEASVGTAALCAFYNGPQGEVLRASLVPGIESINGNAFEVLGSQLDGKRVAVIGHFPDLERLAERCQLSILERRPQPGDLPDSAAEYVLPEQDFVFITGTTLTNKTLPRLLELSAKATVVLVGPSTPLAGVLFEYGVSYLGGLVVREADQVRRLTAENAEREVLKAGGQMVLLRAPRASAVPR